MGLKTPHVRPINRNDLSKFNHHGETVRGFVIEIDGEVEAVYGIIHTVPLQAFSEISEEMKKYPKTIMRAILSFKDILNQYNNTIYAIPSPEHPNSSKVLERVGFKLINGVYQCKR
jgi:hypothetical protein